MTKSKSFIYGHQAKLQWKFIKHGAGVLTGKEEREGNARSADFHSGDMDLDFIETPVRY